ncbi:hypothetical protein [Curtobacterium sp. 9128]|uniref:hypothetical protein n=1 Tax=Curtobacterium sp. 9128 TaxID=1793722 RepID=UPI0011A9900D|nr:hypothetical protein [Curtobacterium sp. 9128]
MITGYDASVAEAHGFKIVHNADGTESSIPVTAAANEAMAQLTAAEANRLSTSAKHSAVTPLAQGNCGTDHLDVYARPSAGAIVINTAYSVNTTSIGQVWHVVGNTANVAFNESFNGANFSTTWTATHVVPISGYGHGQAEIQAGSHAILINGGTCTAIVEGDSW